MVLSFEPLPKEYFAPDSPPARLTNFRERWRLLQQDGPDVFCALPFNERLRRMTALQFAQLLAAAGVRGVPTLLAEDGRTHWGMGGLDRLLAGARTRTFRVVALPEALVRDRVPCEPHDVPVDALLTERRFLKTKTSP